MSILSVDLISPIGSGTTITLNATEVKTGNEITVGTGASIFSPAGNTLTFGTNNVERIRIKNDGNVGLNETNPGHKLTVGGDAYFGFTTPNDAARQIIFNANRGSAGQTLANINWQWNSKNVAQIRGIAGSDTTNKDDGHLAFFTSAANNLVERVRIDSSGRIGIGENNPTRDVVLKTSGSVQFSMVGATNQSVYLNFGDTDDDNIGAVYYDNPNDRMIIRANTNNAVQVKSNGNMAINDGDLEIGTSGHGISFAATSDGSGMTSELLDDYEEGSFSPTLVNGNNGYRFQQGTYTKIGNLVTFTAYIETSATPPSGNLVFGNLPYTSIGSRSWVFPFHTNRTSFGTASFDSRAYMGGNSTNVYIYYPVNSSSSNFQPVNQNGMNAANASAVWISGSYQTAS